MMKFEIVEQKKNNKYFEINLNKDCLKKLKAENLNFEFFSINAVDLKISDSLYGNNKKESLVIQKNNAKQLSKLYSVCVKAVKILKKNPAFSGVFYVDGLSQKKNNNDFMLASMLELKFNVKHVNRLSQAVSFASDFLDKENEINNMCDFKDNLCVCHRDKKKSGVSGCCPSFCKHTKAGVCNQKCLACKIFMCDYLINEKGYYFTPHTLPILQKHLTILERFLCFGLLFKTHRQTTNRLWGIRSLEILFVLMLLAAVVFCFI